MCMECGESERQKSGDWSRYELLVLNGLKELKDSHSSLIDTMTGVQKELGDVKIELNTLKVKAAIWGTGAGAAVAGIISLVIGVLIRIIKPL